jgi:hypothetical protein
VVWVAKGRSSKELARDGLLSDIQKSIQMQIPKIHAELKALGKN